MWKKVHFFHVHLGTVSLEVHQNYQVIKLSLYPNWFVSVESRIPSTGILTSNIEMLLSTSLSVILPNSSQSQFIATIFRGKMFEWLCIYGKESRWSGLNLDKRSWTKKTAEEKNQQHSHFTTNIFEWNATFRIRYTNGA